MQRDILLSLPLSRWTLRRLAEVIEREYKIQVSWETIRKILKENGISFKKSKAYIQSPDPLYQEKKEMLSMLEKELPKDIAFIYQDESRKAVKEYPGEAWTEEKVLKHNQRQKTKGVVSFFLSKEGRIYGIAREGYANHEKFLEFVFFLALEYKSLGYKSMLIVLDNSRYYKKAEEGIKKIGEAVGIEIMWFYLPKYSPWLNPVEAEWRLLKKLYLPLREFSSKEEFIELFFKFIKDRVTRQGEKI